MLVMIGAIIYRGWRKMAKWIFRCSDNGGKKQFFTVSAKDKPSAIEKGFKRARKYAAGDINSSDWECKLIRV